MRIMTALLGRVALSLVFAHLLSSAACTKAQPADGGAAPAAKSNENAKTEPAAPQAGAPTAGPAGAAAQPAGFTGRWRVGPEKAAIRLVIISDYQCHLCKRIEPEALALVKSRTDMSFSVKHFPMGTECNEFTKEDMHPLACRAARVAEAAGLLGGNDKFFEMHSWLYEQPWLFDGKFKWNEDAVKAKVQTLGFDWTKFQTAMTGPEVTERIRADVKEGQNLGLYFTPMVFINGIEMRGVTAETQKLTAAIEQVTKLNPPVLGPENDQPPQALDKCVGDWRESPQVVQMPDKSDWFKGPADAPVRVTIFGDYGLPGTKEMWDDVTAATKDAKNVRIQFRHFPFSKKCNKYVQNPNKNSEFGCDAAKAAEAVGKAGGAAAYWRMHDLLLGNQGQFGPQYWKVAAGNSGVAGEAFDAALGDPAVQAALDEDIDAAVKMQVSRVPFLLINERAVLRWKLPGTNDAVLKRILEEAAKQPPRGKSGPQS